jgi:hypothetical protein
MGNFSMPMIAQAIVLLFAFVMAVRMLFSIRTSAGAGGLVKALVAVTVGVAALWLGMRRDTYLPFLGYAALPPTLIKDRHAPANANVEAVLEVPDAADGTKVLYWGARPSKDRNAVAPNPWKAYDDWSNAGVAEVKSGVATIIFECPGEYQVRTRALKRHVHYRVVSDKGMIGPVKTTYVEC